MDRIERSGVVRPARGVPPRARRASLQPRKGHASEDAACEWLRATFSATDGAKHLDDRETARDAPRPAAERPPERHALVLHEDELDERGGVEIRDVRYGPHEVPRRSRRSTVRAGFGCRRREIEEITDRRGGLAGREHQLEDVDALGQRAEHRDRSAPFGDDEVLAVLDAAQVAAQVLAQVTDTHVLHRDTNVAPMCNKSVTACGAWPVPSSSSAAEAPPLVGLSGADARIRPVHLRSLRIRGFKSFPDTLEITLEPGVAVIVGPNGSGKSNIADAIVWAAGSLTPSELRAEKPDDVLFAGGGDRKAAEHCEVELVFDNEDGTWPDLDFSEVSIARRLVRGAEGQYLVNRAAVRRTDLVEILADVGLGAAMHSIVGQGKVEQVLASKPEDRRAFVEEAAGLGKFKRRRHRAELKLARVALQVERARDVEDEVRKRLRPLALQATAAERAEKLGVEIAGARARGSRSSISPTRVRDARRREERRDAAAFSKRGAQARLEGLLADRARAEEELSDAAGRREAAVAARYRLQGGIERLELRAESAAALLERFRAETSGGAGRARAARAMLARLELEAIRTAEAARTAERERAAARRARGARARARSRARAGARRAGGPSACGARARRGRRAPRARRARRRAGRGASRRGRACARARPPSSPTTRRSGSRSSSALAPQGSAASPSLRADRRRTSSREYPGRPARCAARRHGAVRHARGVRLRPDARRALVRRARPPRPSCSSCRGAARRSHAEARALEERGRGRDARRGGGGRASACRRGGVSVERAEAPRDVDRRADALDRLVDLADGARDGHRRGSASCRAGSRRRFALASTRARRGRASSARSCARSARPR